MYVCLFLFKLDSMIYEDRIFACPGHLFISMVYYDICSYYMVIYINWIVNELIYNNHETWYVR